MLETVGVFLLYMKRSLCIYVESLLRSDRKSLFSMDALKQFYQPVEITYWASNAFECKNKKDHSA